MVREARFSWDDRRPLPSELSRRGWDCDDPADEVEDRSERRRLRHRPSAKKPPDEKST